jgi:hypothetical protein
MQREHIGDLGDQLRIGRELDVSTRHGGIR